MLCLLRYIVSYVQGGKCGICGENYSGKKLFEKGGEYYRGYSVKEYKTGDVIDVHVEV